jgi:hypothetical protein
MSAAAAALPFGSEPIITFTNIGTPFTLPLAGMPANGWGPFGLGSWRAVYPATGATIVNVPDGVKIDMLLTIEKGLAVVIAPTTDGVFNFSQIPDGGAKILQVGLGALLQNASPNASAAMISPGAISGTTTVYSVNDSTRAVFPPDTGPIIRLQGNDGAVAAQINLGPGGGLPDGWVVGGGPGSGILYLNGIEAANPLIPGFTGGGGVSVVNGTAARNLNITVNPAQWAGPPSTNPKTQQEYDDRVATLLVTLNGGPIPLGHMSFLQLGLDEATGKCPRAPTHLLTENPGEAGGGSENRVGSARACPS